MLQFAKYIDAIGNLYMKEQLNVVAVLNELQYKSLEERYQMATNFYFGSEKIEKHFFAAYTLYSQLAHEGHAPSQYWLGLAYFKNFLCANNNAFLNIFTKESLLPDFIEYVLETHAVDDNDEYYFRVQKIIKTNLIDAKYWLELAAEQENVNAMFLLAEMYLEGKCGNNTNEYNLQMAKQYFQQAQKQEHALSIFRLAEISIIENELENAMLLYKKAASLGCATAQCHIGIRYKYGEGVEKNLLLAIDYIKQAAHVGQPIAQYYLSKEYINENILTADIDAAIQWCLKAAEGGYAVAQNIMGLRYAYGEGLEKDIDKAIYWYRKAVAQQLTDAQFNLAKIYHNHPKSKTDLFKAVQLYTKAAASQHVDAKYELGILYTCFFMDLLDGDTQDLLSNSKDLIYYFKKLVFWYNEANNGEHKNAAYQLGIFYLSLKESLLIQKILEINDKDIDNEIFKYFNIAAQKGHLLTQYNLPLVYKDEDEVAQNLEVANKLSQQSQKTIFYGSRSGDKLPTFSTDDDMQCAKFVNIKFLI